MIDDGSSQWLAIRMVNDGADGRPQGFRRGVAPLVKRRVAVTACKVGPPVISQ